MADPKAAAILAAYRDYLLSDGKSPTTVDSYTGDIAAFVDWLESKDTAFAGAMKRFHITSYRNNLVEQQFEINTINKKNMVPGTEVKRLFNSQQKRAETGSRKTAEAATAAVS